jgi:type II secretory pathway pseudopilin PulG
VRTRPGSPRRGAAAFTLLEAVLALAILSSLVVVAMSIRAQSLAQTQRLEARAAAQRETQAIIDMAHAGLLPDPEVDPRTLARTWRWTHLGEPFTLTATRHEAPNPAGALTAPGGRPLSDRIVLWRYELDYRGLTTEFYWHR